jgi:tetratricopeptide (TPR) repeat protein
MRLVVITLGAFFLAHSVGAAERARLEPLAAVAALSEGPLATVEELVDAALLLSGLTLGDIGAYRVRFLAIGRALDDAVGQIADPRERAHGVLVFLHDRMLSDYVERQTRVDVLLDEGTYNCVSSAVAYMLLNRVVGLRTGGVRTSDHAFCRVLLGDAEVDVETTTKLGFDPGTRHEFVDDFSGQTGYSYVPANQDAHRQETDDVGLLALILHNRVAFAGDAGRHLQAVGPAVDLYSLTQDDSAFAVLQLALSNMGAYLGRVGDYATGVALVDNAVERYGADARLLQVRHDLYYNRVVTLAQRGDLEQAQETLDHAALGDKIDAKTRAELTANIAQQRAAALARDAHYLAAAAVLLLVLEDVPSEPALLANLEAYLHNHFVQLVNAQQLDDAAAFLVEARAQHPTSRLLAEDLAELDRFILASEGASDGASER